MEKGMNRHAYCIMAHQDPDLFRVLVSMLDHPLNDIYVHLDKRVDLDAFRCPPLKHSRLFFIADRIAVQWGNTNQIDTEFALLNKAFQGGNYSYFHILSGVDLPLKSQEYIHHFMDEENAGAEFVSIDKMGPDALKDLEYKTRYYHFFVKDIKKPDHFSLSYLFHYYMHASLIKCQQCIGIRRRYPMELKKGANWVSITHDFTEYLLQKEILVKRLFRRTLCADEIFLQSVLWNSPFKHNIYNLEQDCADGNMREIDWTQGHPKVWTPDELQHLLSCGKLFARKFSSKCPVELQGL